MEKTKKDKIVNEIKINDMKQIQFKKLKDIILKGEKCVVKILMKMKIIIKLVQDQDFFVNYQ